MPHSQSLGSPTAGRVSLNSVDDKSLSNFQKLLLFTLFLFYGPSVSAFGQLTYVEIIVLTFVSGFIFGGLKIKKVELTIVLLLFLAAGSQATSDLANNLLTSETVKRVGTYVVLAFVLIGLKVLARDHFDRISWMWLGYSFSYIFLLFNGAAQNSGYYLVPWRLGLGSAVTVLVLLSYYQFHMRRGLVLIASLVVLALDIFQGARAIALISLIPFVMIFLSEPGSSPLPKFKIKLLLTFLLAVVIFISASFFLARVATNYQLLPTELQKKMEMQLSSRFGFFSSARPDTAAAIYAISKRPFLGYGSSGSDPDVLAYYADVSSSAYLYLGQAIEDSIRRGVFLDTSNKGTPSHSHLFGAWADAGILAALVWMYILALAVYIATISCIWHHRIAPFVTYLALSAIWDILFSPGPIRMDMALKLVVFIHLLSRTRNVQIGKLASW